MEQIQVREEALPILKSSIALKERLLKAKLKNYRNRLKFFEQKHKMKSKDFIKTFNQGTLGDDAEWFDWVFVYETYTRLKNQEKLVEELFHDHPKKRLQWRSRATGARMDLADGEALYTAMDRETPSSKRRQKSCAFP